MGPRTLLASIGVVTLAVLASAFILVEDDDSGSSDTFRVSFNANGGSGGYHIDVIPGAAYYMPTATLSHAEKTGCCLVGWSCDGQFYEIGAEAKGTRSDVAYDAVWVSGTAIQMNMGTWSASVTKNVFGDYQEAKVKNPSITVRNYPDTIRSSGEISGNITYSNRATIDASFTPTNVGTYFIDVHYTIRYSWGTDSEGGISGEFNFGSQEERSYTDSYIVTFVDPLRDSRKEVSWNVGGDVLRSSQVLGNTITAPAAGELAGTENLAWWTVNYYGTGDIYILPGTRIPVEEDKNLDFVAMMHDEGQGAIGFDFRGGQSSSVQIANIYDVGSEIILPSDVSLSGYRLAGWTASFDSSVLYLPGTVIGRSVEGIDAVCTDTDYIEMKACWVKDSDPHHRVTFQNTDGISVASDHVPHGMKVFLPIYGFDSLSGRLDKWMLDDEECGIGSTRTIDTDMVFDAKYPVPTSPFDTCTVIFIAGDAQTNMASATLNKGDMLILPKVDKAFHVFCYWYENNGNIWGGNDRIYTDLLLNARWERIFDMSVDGNMVTLDVKAGHDYEIIWGDGTTGDENSCSHTYADNSSGKLFVKMLDGDHAGQTAWAIYQIGSRTPADPLDPVPHPGPQPMPGTEPDPEPAKEDLTAYYIMGGFIVAILGLFIARRFI